MNAHPFRHIRTLTRNWIGAGLVVLLLTWGNLGCQTSAPIHLWQPAKLASFDQERIVLMGIKGPQKTADAIRQELLAQANRKLPRSIHQRPDGFTLVLPETLAPEETIRLVSGTDYSPDQIGSLDLPSNDLAVAAAARRSGIDQMLHGEIMTATGREDSTDQLSIVWRLVGLSSDATTAGLPVSVNQKIIQLRHPDLLNLSDPQERLRNAMVRETIALLKSSVARSPATLANPRGTLGSRSVRKGNQLARTGNWPAAEDKWVATLKRYPGKTSAWINAAIAASARQDFVEAKIRAKRAVTLAALDPLNRRLAENTLVWIEMRQREYHEAFGLPDPSDGWRVSRVE